MNDEHKHERSTLNGYYYGDLMCILDAPMIYGQNRVKVSTPEPSEWEH